MVVQAEDGGQPALRAGRLQEDGLGRRPVGELPAQVLDVQAVVDELMLDLGLRDAARSAAAAGNRAAAAAPGRARRRSSPAGTGASRNDSRAGPSPTKPAAQGP